MTSSCTSCGIQLKDDGTLMNTVITRAATVLRDRVHGTTPTPWETVPGASADAAYITTMDPAVGVQLAHLLIDIEHCENRRRAAGVEGPSPYGTALGLARQILRESA